MFIPAGPEYAARASWRRRARVEGRGERTVVSDDFLAMCVRVERFSIGNSGKAVGNMLSCCLNAFKVCFIVPACKSLLFFW